MKLAKHKQKNKEPLKEATLVFLIKNNEVLLAMKKRGFGEGKWNGVGGKRADGETLIDAAIRETEEEIGVLVGKLKEVALLNFYHETRGGQQVTVYLTEIWEGKPIETEEMAPKWFDKSNLPFKDMWPEEEHWLPKVLEGKHLEADFLFNEEGKLLDFEIIEK